MDNKKNHNAHKSANVRQYLPILSIVIIFFHVVHKYHKKRSVGVVLKDQLNKPCLCTQGCGTEWTDSLETLTTVWNWKLRPVPAMISMVK